MDQFWFILNNWLRILSLWVWTFSLTPEDTGTSVREALKIWYKLIDTANIYLNEKAVWKWIKESWVVREVYLFLQRFGRLNMGI